MRENVCRTLGGFRDRFASRRRHGLHVGALTAFCVWRAFGLILGPEGSTNQGRAVPDFGRQPWSGACHQCWRGAERARRA